MAACPHPALRAYENLPPAFQKFFACSDRAGRAFASRRRHPVGRIRCPARFLWPAGARPEVSAAAGPSEAARFGICPDQAAERVAYRTPAIRPCGRGPVKTRLAAVSPRRRSRAPIHRNRTLHKAGGFGHKKGMPARFRKDAAAWTGGGRGPRPYSIGRATGSTDGRGHIRSRDAHPPAALPVQEETQEKFGMPLVITWNVRAEPDPALLGTGRHAGRGVGPARAGSRPRIMPRNLPPNTGIRHSVELCGNPAKHACFI